MPCFAVRSVLTRTNVQSCVIGCVASASSVVSWIATSTTRTLDVSSVSTRPAPASSKPRTSMSCSARTPSPLNTITEVFVVVAGEQAHDRARTRSHERVGDGGERLIVRADRRVVAGGADMDRARRRRRLDTATCDPTVGIVWSRMRIESDPTARHERAQQHGAQR